MALGGGTDVSPTLYAAEMKKQVSKAAAAAEFEGGSIAEMAFQIDDLLDFSNEDIAGPIGMQLSDDTGDSSLSTIETVSCTSSGTGTGDRCRYPNVLDEDTRKGSDDLCVPCDDLEELEWLSNFVHEEPFVALSASCETFRSVGTGTGSAFGCQSQSNNKHEKAVEASSSKEQFRSGSPNSVLESSASSGRATSEYPELAVRGRPRTKRSRAGPRVWTSTILSSSSSADTLESYSHSKSNKRCEVAKGSSRSPARALSPVLSGDTDVFSSDQEEEEEEEEEDEGDVDGEESLSVRKQTQTYKKCGGGKKGQDVMQPRRCMHCQTQRTPQWRTGPMGPKTLCNACGVRYKSGRLLPEYRPAGSPGYVNEKHSNSHKKILEMRRQKELSELAQQQQQQQQQQHSSMSYLQEADYRVRV